MSALVRLLRRLLLRPSLLDQDLQAGAEAGGGVHSAEEERLARPGNLPTLRLRQGPFLQGVERCNILVQVQAPHVPEDLKLEAAAVSVLFFLFFLLYFHFFIFFFERTGCGDIERSNRDRTDCVGSRSRRPPS